MQDSWGRTIDYLRLSVTEACNFRCVYCAPNGHRPSVVPPLSTDEIERIVCAAVALGITRIRLTGGEPLMRRDIVEIVGKVASIGGVRDLALTTNGFRLAELAGALRDAGLRRVNVSLDSLRRERFARIVGRDSFETVWRGIQAAEEAGLAPLKINVVMMKGVNDDEIVDFARLTIERGWHVRFIELMPVGASETAREFYVQHFIAAIQVRLRLPGLKPVGTAPLGNGPARILRLPKARGTIGLITPTSEHFCSACNRIRVTAQGIVRPCLFDERGFELRGVLGTGRSTLERMLASAVEGKPKHRPLEDSFKIVAGSMSEIGG